MRYRKLIEDSNLLDSKGLVDNLKRKCKSTNYSKYVNTLILGLLGSLIGGPIGLVVIHFCHTPMAVSVIIETTSIIVGASTPHFLQKTHNQNYLENLSSNDARKLRFCFSQESVEENFQLFLQLISDNKAIQKWYENLLVKYYKNKNNQILERIHGLNLAKHLGYLKDTLNKMVLELVNFLLDDTYELKPLEKRETKDIDDKDIDGKENDKENDNNDDDDESVNVVKIYTICERILMMSLYYDLYKISRVINLSKDKLYKIKRKSYQLEIETDPKIIRKFNSLPLKITVPQKISLLLDICDLIANRQFIGCDCLLIAFVNNLVKSEILNPFAEILIMESFLPGRLLGKEAYALSTFSASVHFIINV